MSIFSRLFNKGPDSEAERESSAEEREDEEKPASDGKASMRPTAPSFQINAPTEDDSSSVAAAPVMQVGAGDKRIARSSRPPRSKVPDVPRSAQQTSQRAAQQGPSRPSKARKAPRVGASTMVMGSTFTAGSGATFAPAPYAPPPIKIRNRKVAERSELRHHQVRYQRRRGFPLRLPSARSRRPSRRRGFLVLVPSSKKTALALRCRSRRRGALRFLAKSRPTKCSRSSSDRHRRPLHPGLSADRAPTPLRLAGSRRQCGGAGCVGDVDVYRSRSGRHAGQRSRCSVRRHRRIDQWRRASIQAFRVSASQYLARRASRALQRTCCQPHAAGSRLHDRSQNGARPRATGLAFAGQR